ncbi:MAG: hypothetical protein ACREX3_20760 [Gammaproteobacteria bacterium]
MGIWKRFRTAGRLSREAADLKASYSVEWSAGERAGVQYFTELQVADLREQLAQYGLQQLPRSQDQVRLYITQYANTRAMNAFLTERGSTDPRALQAFGVAFGTTLGDLLLGERKLAPDRVAEEDAERLERVRLHTRASLKAMPSSEYENWKRTFSTKFRKDKRLLGAFRQSAARSTISPAELKFLETLFRNDGSWKDDLSDEDILIGFAYTQIMTGEVDVRIPRAYLQYLEPEERARVPDHWIQEQ